MPLWVQSVQSVHERCRVEPAELESKVWSWSWSWSRCRWHVTSSAESNESRRHHSKPADDLCFIRTRFVARVPFQIAETETKQGQQSKQSTYSNISAHANASPWSTSLLICFAPTIVLGFVQRRLYWYYTSRVISCSRCCMKIMFLVVCRLSSANLSVYYTLHADN